MPKMAETYVVIVGTKETIDTVDLDGVGQWVHGPFHSQDEASKWADEVRMAFYEAKADPNIQWPYGDWFVEVQPVFEVTSPRSAARNWYADEDD